MTDDTLLPFDLPAVCRKKLTVDFDGGNQSSDAGLLLLREVERKLGVCRRLAEAMPDRRDCAAVIPILPRACAGPWSVAWHDDGRSMDQPGRDVPPRAPAGPDGPVGLTWPPSAWRLRTSPWRTGFTTSGSPFRALHAHVVPGGENFVALAERLQNELWGAGRRAATAPQCAHYGMTPIPTRITRS